MTRTLLVMLVLAGAGCQSQKSCLFYRERDRVDDPMYSIEEQHRRGREYLGVTEDDGLAPKTFSDRPGVTGR